MWMLSGGMPNSPAMPALRHGETLARRVDRQPVAIPRRDDRVRLHGVVILRRRLIDRVDAFRRRGKARFDITSMHLGRVAEPTAGGTKLSSCCRGRSRAGSRFVARRQQRGAFRRGLQRLGNHDRDRLVRVTHLVVLQEIEPEHEGVGLGVRILRERRPVGWRHDLDDTGMRLRRLHVEEGRRGRARCC